ncbi:MAG: YlbE-like family protein [Bacilli bacterium]|nr:YlbE-like family protein [Bacilli bacterium]
MKLDTIVKIKNNPMLQKYIRENSYWYKLLNRNPSSINKMIEEMKKNYKMTFEDKIDDLSDKMNLVKSFMDAIK